MADNKSLVRIDRKSSIESEPRTLRLGQIRFAREAALYVMNTMTIEHAMKIFTEGLQPVESKKEGRDKAMMGWRGEVYDQEEQEEEEEEEEEEELRQMERFGGVLSAPF